MSDIILGVLAIIGVIIIFAMKESENKWIVYIAWIIILCAKIFS